MIDEEDSYESNREKLREIQQVFQQSVKNNTIEDMRKHIDKDFSFVSFTDKSFDNFDAFAKQWKISRAEMVGNGSFTTELNPGTTIFEGDIAICKGNASNQLVDKKGKSFEYNSNWTVVFKQSDGAWKVLRAHNSLDPFANPMLVSGIKSHLFKTAVVALFVGCIATFLLTALF